MRTSLVSDVDMHGTADGEKCKALAVTQWEFIEPVPRHKSCVVGRTWNGRCGLVVMRNVTRPPPGRRYTLCCSRCRPTDVAPFPLSTTLAPFSESRSIRLRINTSCSTRWALTVAERTRLSLSEGFTRPCYDPGLPEAHGDTVTWGDPNDGVVKQDQGLLARGTCVAGLGTWVVLQLPMLSRGIAGPHFAEAPEASGRG